MNAFYEATVGKGGLMSIVRVPNVCKWQYLAPFFGEFMLNNNPAPLVTNPYGNLDRTGLVERGLVMNAAAARPRDIFAALCGVPGVELGGLATVPYTVVADDLARCWADKVGAYEELVRRLGGVFRDQEHVPAEKVEDFAEVALALLEHRAARGFARAFLTHVLGCCIVEPGAYLQELQAVCPMDPRAFAQAFGTRRPGDFSVGVLGVAPTAEPAWDFALGLGHFENIPGAGTFFVPDGKGARQAWSVPGAGDGEGAENPGEPGDSRAPGGIAGGAGAGGALGENPGGEVVVEVGRAPLHGGASVILDDPCASMAHLTVCARRAGDGGLVVELTDHSTCGTVVLQETEGGDYAERRLGEVMPGDDACAAGRGSTGADRAGRAVVAVDDDGAGASGVRFAGCKLRPQALASVRLSDGDLVVPAPRFTCGADGAAILDPAACPCVIRVAIVRRSR